MSNHDERLNENNTAQPSPSFIFNDRQVRYQSEAGERCGCGPFSSKDMPSTLDNQKSDAKTEIGKDKKHLDSYLATTVTQLSARERETALEDLHGIATCPEEELEAMEAALRRLDAHLNDIKAGTAYEEAEQMDLSHVSDRAFRVMFLRGTRYDPKKAAKQMIAFFNSKLKIFGRDLLAKHITMGDLDEDDREAIRGGSLQVLPERDRSGRQIIFNFRGIGRFKSFQNEIRAKYYVFMSMLESEETQKKGIVVLGYVIGEFRDKENRPGLGKLAMMVNSLPMHMAGFHFCCDDYKQYLMLSALIHLFPKDHAARFRIHYGAHTECQYALPGHGIPVGSIPISQATGEAMMYNHIVWYQERQKIDMERDRAHVVASTFNSMKFIETSDVEDFSLDETFVDNAFDNENPAAEHVTDSAGIAQPALVNNDEHVTSTISITPRSKDVLIGPTHKHHPGTVRLHEILTENQETFESIEQRREKTEFASLLVQFIKSTGARFLSYDRSTQKWVEMDDKTSRNTVSKIFRNRRRSARTGKDRPACTAKNYPQSFADHGPDHAENQGR
eukprot:scaffold3103_cov136-Cylindrotheca_fusiformis.AAC.35